MADKNKSLKTRHSCPFCDAQIAEAAFPYCEACGLLALRCPRCQMPVPRDAQKCPHCGADIRKTVAEGG
jgi:predicted amidophosphoribosyltransferase